MKYIFIIMSLMLVIGCQQPEEENLSAHNSQNSVDWPGKYFGVLPCADCEGIETEIELFSDLTFIRSMKYLGKNEIVFADEGKFSWNEKGNKIILKSENANFKDIFFVGENILIQLDQNGDRIKGNLSQHYILKKNKKSLSL